jgi:hypothetical protein
MYLNIRKSWYYDKLKNFAEYSKYRILAFTFFSVLLFFRQTHTILNPQPWAEEGMVFLQDAYSMGFNSIINPYAGYYLPGTRGFISLFVSVSPIHAILFMHIFALLVGIISIFFFIHPIFRFVVRNDFLRFLGICLIIISPFWEAYLTMTNIQWLEGFWIICWGILIIFNFQKFLDATIKTKIIITAFAIYCAISTPLSYFFILIFPFWAWNNKFWFKDRKKAFTQFMWLLPIYVSFPYILFSLSITRSQYNIIPSLTQMINFLSIHVCGRALFKYITFHPFIFSYLLSIFFIIIFIYLLFMKRNRIVVFLVTILVIYSSVIAYTRPTPEYFPAFSLIGFSGGDRYLFIPFSILILVLLLSIEMRTSKWIRVIASLFLICICINSINYYQIPPFNDLSFNDRLSDCFSSGNDICSIPINPPGWKMVFSNDYQKHYLTVSERSKPIIPLSSTKSDKIKFNIDEFQIINNSYYIRGWAFPKNNDMDFTNTINLLITYNDSSSYGYSTFPASRPDVSELYKKLNINLDKSGFEAMIPCKILTNKSYEIFPAIQINNSWLIPEKGYNLSQKSYNMDEEDNYSFEKIIEKTKPIIPLPSVKSEKVKFNIDVCGIINNSYYIRGWAFTQSNDTNFINTINLLFTNNTSILYGYSTYPTSRPDVTVAYKKFNINLDKSGFEAMIPCSVLSNKPYEIFPAIQINNSWHIPEKGYNLY